MQRALTAFGVTNIVVDSCSIDRPARGRAAKSDRLDATALLDTLGDMWMARSVAGESSTGRASPTKIGDIFIAS